MRAGSSHTPPKSAFSPLALEDRPFLDPPPHWRPVVTLEIATHRSRPVDKHRRFCQAGLVILDTLDATPEAFAAGTGWDIKPEGACKGDVCVPLPEGFSVANAAERLGMALVRDDDMRVWALGPETIGGRALATAEAPELALPDVDGNEFHLSSLRGQKVVLVSWAPY
jgi:hypothetical protein